MASARLASPETYLLGKAGGLGHIALPIQVSGCCVLPVDSVSGTAPWRDGAGVFPKMMEVLCWPVLSESSWKPAEAQPSQGESLYGVLLVQSP